jgi:hypothetical protein
MYRICTEIKTGKRIELQGGGDSHSALKDKALDDYRKMNLDTLKKNAINQGYKEEEIEVKFITDEEAQVWFNMIEKENAKIPKGKSAQELKIEDLETRISKLEIK